MDNPNGNLSGAKRGGQEAEKQATKPKHAKMEPAEKPKKTRGPYKKRTPLQKDGIPKELPKSEASKIKEEFRMLSEKDRDYILSLVKSTSDDQKFAEFDCTSTTSFDAKHMLILQKYMRPSRKNLNQLSSEDQATMKACREIRKRTLKNIRDAKAYKPEPGHECSSSSSSSSSGSDSDSSSDEENEPNAEESVTKTKEPPNSN